MEGLCGRDRSRARRPWRWVPAVLHAWRLG